MRYEHLLSNKHFILLFLALDGRKVNAVADCSVFKKATNFRTPPNLLPAVTSTPLSPPSGTNPNSLCVLTGEVANFPNDKSQR